MWARFRRCVWELSGSPGRKPKKTGDMGEVKRLSVHGVVAAPSS